MGENLLQPCHKSSSFIHSSEVPFPEIPPNYIVYSYFCTNTIMPIETNELKNVGFLCKFSKHALGNLKGKHKECKPKTDMF